MAFVKDGDTIRIHYTGRLEDGTVFDSSEGEASLEIKLGRGEFIPGLEKGVLGMKAGEKRTLRLSPEEAYGPHRQERIFDYDKGKLQGGFVPEVGVKFQMFRADGVPVPVTVVEVSEHTVKLDCNHPLAGKNLIFDVMLEEIL